MFSRPNSKTVIEQFQSDGFRSSNTYKCFTLVCPSLSPTIRPIETGLARLPRRESLLR